MGGPCEKGDYDPEGIRCEGAESRAYKKVETLRRRGRRSYGKRLWEKRTENRGGRGGKKGGGSWGGHQKRGEKA